MENSVDPDQLASTQITVNYCILFQKEKVNSVVLTMGTQFIMIFIFLLRNKEKYPFININLEQTRVLSTL